MAQLILKAELEQRIYAGVKDIGMHKVIYNCIHQYGYTTDEASDLYQCIKKLDSPMLSSLPCIFLNYEKVNIIICRVLYVAGKWSELADFYFITNYLSLFNEPLQCTTINYDDTLFKRLYFGMDRTSRVRITIDDSRIGLDCSMLLDKREEF